MKVRDDNSPIQNMIPGHMSQGKKEAAANAASFDAMLHERSQSETRDTLNKLLDKITSQGELVASRKNIGDIKKYREMIADFLEQAVRSSYEADKENTFDAKGRYKEYAIVKKINVSIEELTKSVLDDQKDNLSILEQLGTIRGLLIDLMI